MKWTIHRLLSHRYARRIGYRIPIRAFFSKRFYNQRLELYRLRVRNNVSCISISCATEQVLLRQLPLNDGKLALLPFWQSNDEWIRGTKALQDVKYFPWNRYPPFKPRFQQYFPHIFPCQPIQYTRYWTFPLSVVLVFRPSPHRCFGSNFDPIVACILANYSFRGRNREAYYRERYNCLRLKDDADILEEQSLPRRTSSTMKANAVVEPLCLPDYLTLLRFVWFQSHFVSPSANSTNSFPLIVRHDKFNSDEQPW